MAEKFDAYHQWLGIAPDEQPPGLFKNNADKRLADVAKLRSQLPAPPPAIAPFDETQAKQHQKRWADYLGEPVEMTNSIGMKFVLIPPGEFDMGSTEEEIEWAVEEGKKAPETRWFHNVFSYESPRHRVKLTKSFYLGMYEVSQAEYQLVTGTNPSAVSATGSESSRVAGQNTNRYPVETVAWNDCVEFCRRLSALPGEQAARRVYRLPTEAEWEFSCRAGSMGRWFFGDDARMLGEYAWFTSNNRARVTFPVGQKKPNGWGLYDMHGNVWERCADWFGEDYYRHSPQIDPVGPPEGSSRVLRGGWSRNSPCFCRSAYRYRSAPTWRSSSVGFRVVVGR